MNLTSRIVCAAAALTLSTAGLTIATDAHAATASTSSATGFDIGSGNGFGRGGGIAIQDAATGSVQPASPYPSTVLIDGVVGQITDVDVTLYDVGHGAASDLDIMLVSPAGTGVMLMSDATVGDIGPATLTFDDEAANAMPGSGLQSGAYRPRDVDGLLGQDVFPAPAPAPDTAGAALSAFDGQSGSGEWHLLVVDDDTGGLGGIDSWELAVTTTGMTGSPSSVVVSGVTGLVTDVRVALDGLTHGNSADVDVMLVGPHGQATTLLSDVGTASPVSGVALVLRDDAPVSAGPILVSGTYRPTNLEGTVTDFYGPGAPLDTTLSVFDGTDANGTWRLFVGDDRDYGDNGFLAGWSLEIVTPDGPVVVTPTPPPATVDTVAPRIIGSTPAAGAKKVRRGASVRATVSEPVLPATVGKATVYLVAKGATRHVRATVGYHNGAVVIDPKRALREHTTYRVVLTPGIRDLAGNALAATSWRFTTR